MPQISATNRAIARYDGMLTSLLNAAVLLSPITSQEAVLSSKIEGTQASLTEVLTHQAGQDYEVRKKRDIQEVINYRIALLHAEQSIKDRPLTLHLIRELHGILMQDVRGAEKTPGTFRTTQNWIGPAGSLIEQARFIPPSPLVMPGFLDNFEAYLSETESDVLVQMAIIHAQFEIIHPFNDGNGRLGRMLIPLFLFQKNVLKRPMFYLSELLEKNDQKYRDYLLAITQSGDWHGWIVFFLEMLDAQAKANIIKVDLINKLYDKLKQQFYAATQSKYAISALDAFFIKPIINARDFTDTAGIDNRSTANTILNSLAAAGLIHLMRKGKGRKPAIYALPDLINIAEGEDAFLPVLKD